jgi:hypothetical protein
MNATDSHGVRITWQCLNSGGTIGSATLAFARKSLADPHVAFGTFVGI